MTQLHSRFLNYDQDGFSQFSIDGVDLLCEYYNNKYRERPLMMQVVSGLGDKDGKAFRRLDDLFNKFCKKDHKLKIIFTTYEICHDTGKELIEHAAPILLTKNKLILLRDNSCGGDTLEILGRFAHFKEIEFLLQKSTGTSIQGDGVSCAILSALILKDLDSEKLEIITGFEAEYEPLPEMVKYSQSKKHVNSISKDFKDRLFKKKGGDVRLMDYVAAGKEMESGEGRAFYKAERFKEDILFLKERHFPESSIDATAAQIIRKRNLDRT